MVGAAKKKCKVCEEADSKYKCPACLIPYCSLGCFKKHKEIPCVKEAVPAEQKFAPKPHVERPYFVDEPSIVLQQSQLESIASSSEVIDALKNEELQKLICKIENSADIESEFDKAMEADAFRLFTDKVGNTLFCL
ncbi:hypothetical protein DCAR_0417935 [Daucus carota subsp. sativus]|uniref:HIT-type domain-containing protein n=1 Tax=Daucus carota subsp. sativus TaxID=79200 RepID=A0AAF0X0T8_DAUCS|nr:hypothetical protein DCAR_0417935 [Daucus carota subsp. sativus]